EIDFRNSSSEIVVIESILILKASMIFARISLLNGLSYKRLDFFHRLFSTSSNSDKRSRSKTGPVTIPNHPKTINLFSLCTNGIHLATGDNVKPIQMRQ